MTSINSELEQQENQKTGAQQCGGRDNQYGNVHGTAKLDENAVEPDDDCRLQFGQQLRVLFLKQAALLVIGCQSLHDAIHKVGAAPSSTDKRLFIELAIIKSRTMEGEADLRCFDARYQIVECLTEHVWRKSEEVLQHITNQAQWRITAVETMLETR